MTVALVVVSHSADLARGVAELAGQMAPDVRVLAVGGADGGGLGTSFDRVLEALQSADAPDGTVVLYDLGSALLTTETALDLADPQLAARVEVVDAPLVEGAVAAATTAQGGADRAAVVSAARAAGAAWSAAPSASAQAGPDAPTPDGTGDGGTGTDGTGADGTGAAGTDAAGPDADGPGAAEVVLELADPMGLHARPVAEFVRSLTGLDAQVRLGREDGPSVDARSVLSVVALAVPGGARVRVRATGPDARAAVERATALLGAPVG